MKTSARRLLARVVAGLLGLGIWTERPPARPAGGATLPPEARPSSRAAGLVPAQVLPGAVAPAGVSSPWLGRVQDDLRRAEYQVSPQPAGDARAGFQAPNRAQNLRTRFEPNAVRWEPRRESAASFEVGLALRSAGTPEDLRPVDAATLTASGNRIEYRRGGLTEWYRNDERGIEQGFWLARPPSGEGPLVLAFEVSGDARPRLDEDAQGVDFLAPDGTRRLRYDSLKANASHGRVLASAMEVACQGADCELRLVVEADASDYPLTIDPLVSNPTWTAESDQADAYFGVSVGTAGDVNGDGYADVIVGASLFDNGQDEEGRAFVYHGSASGPSATPNWTGEADRVGTQYGFAVASAGDVNGDGYGDVVIGAPWYNDDAPDEGAAYVYHGSASGLGASPAWMQASGQGSALLGYSVATAGDVNGDGYADVVVGALYYDNGETDEGLAYVYHGSPSGLSYTANWTAEGNQVDAHFGGAVASVGDVNGDGYADLAVGAGNYSNGETGEGRASVYHGSASGLSATPNWTGEGDQAGVQFGGSLGTAGDLNGDGFADLIVGANGYTNGEIAEGRAYAFHGSASGLSASPSWTAESNQMFAYFGVSVGTAGDVNGDGYADVVVGAFAYENGEASEGGAFLFQGAPSGLATTASWTAEGDQAGAIFGSVVAGAGDVNGDGYSDVVVGACRYDNGESNEGRAFLYLGSASGPAASPAWSAESDQAGAHSGWSVAGAGDVNGDGYADIAVGAPQFDNGEADEGRVFVYHGSPSGPASTPSWSAEGDQALARFGAAVTPAGDVNGDGYADLIVGAPNYDNGSSDEGRALVYHGSPAGLSTTPAWTAEGDQAVASFGSAVGTAGDVNGDGYSDVVVGANGYSNGEANEGAVFAYYGSAGGLAATAAWSVESNQAGADLGFPRVGSTGDVNGDGYADVVVGAHLYDNSETDEGRAYVFHGSSTGLSPTPNWTAEGDQAGAEFGWSVAGAGDVNGDGFADLVVGARLYDNGETDEGRVTVYHGSAGGVAAVPAQALEGHQASAFLGQAVSTAGDVNGDGFADILLAASGLDGGEPDEGRVQVHLGSAAGVVATPGWTAESNQAMASFGSDVAAAGDVNGDGFADVLVGADGFDNAESDEGRAFVFYGGGGAGRDVRAQQRHGAGPVQPWGVSPDLRQFVVRQTVTSPAGRTQAKLEVEACPSAVPMGHASCVRSVSAAWQDTSATAGGVIVDAVANVLGDSTLYRWRVRSLLAPYSVTQAGITAPPRPAHGPWRRLSGQSREADLRSAPPQADVSITKEDGSTTEVPGTPVTYTIVASNGGPSNAPSVTVADAFPATCTGATWTCIGTGGGACAAAGSGDIADTANLPAGASVTYTATCTIASGATGTLANTATATVGGGVTDPTLGNNSATDTDTLVPEADISVGLTDTPDPVTGLGTLTYTLTVANGGPSASSAVSVSHTLPEDATFQSVTGSSWSCTVTSTVSCSRAGLAAGTTAPVLTVLMTVGPASTSLGSSATATAPDFDPTMSNNWAWAYTTVNGVPHADLEIQMSDGGVTALWNRPLTYTITVDNNGPDDVTGAIVTDGFPAGLAGMTWTCTASPGSSCAPGGSGNIGDTVNLLGGGRLTYSAAGVVTYGTTGPLANTATVSASLHDPDTGNNSSTTNTPVDVDLIFKDGFEVIEE